MTKKYILPPILALALGVVLGVLTLLIYHSIPGYMDDILPSSMLWVLMAGIAGLCLNRPIPVVCLSCVLLLVGWTLTVDGADGDFMQLKSLAHYKGYYPLASFSEFGTGTILAHAVGVGAGLGAAGRVSRNGDGFGYGILRSLVPAVPLFLFLSGIIGYNFEPKADTILYLVLATVIYFAAWGRRAVRKEGPLALLVAAAAVVVPVELLSLAID